MFDRDTVKRALEEQGRTTKWLARKCGITTETMGQILRAEGRMPSRPVTKLMAIHLELPTLDPDFGPTPVARQGSKASKAS